MATSNRGRTPKSFYFSRLYTDPFHQDTDRISQIDFRTFDPFVPEARQTVANCKKHRRQRHELSDKCKHVLAIVDAQERLLSTKPETAQLAGYSAQGAQMKNPDISIEFGDGIPESAKEYVKFWIKESGMVVEPFSRQYDVHNIEDEHNHQDKPSIVLMAPFVDVETTDENQLKVISQQFFQDPKIFAAKKKVGNLRIYSVNKRTGEEDAVGFVEQLPIKVIGSDVIGKNLQKAVINGKDVKEEPKEEPVRKKPEPPTEFGVEGIENATPEQQQYLDILSGVEGRIASLERQIKDIETKGIKEDDVKTKDHLDVLREQLNDKKSKFSNTEKKLYEQLDAPQKEEFERNKKARMASVDRELQAQEDIKRNKADADKKKKIFSDLLDPAKNIAPNRVPNGGTMNPIGNALRVAETPFHMLANVTGAVSNYINIKRDREEQSIKDKLKQAKEQIKDEEYTPGEFKIHRKEPEPEEEEEEMTTGSATTGSAVTGSAVTGTQTVEQDKTQDIVDKPALEQTAEAEASIKQQAPQYSMESAKTPLPIKQEVPKPEIPMQEKKASGQYLYTLDFNTLCKIKKRGL